MILVARAFDSGGWDNVSFAFMKVDATYVRVLLYRIRCAKRVKEDMGATGLEWWDWRPQWCEYYSDRIGEKLEDSGDFFLQDRLVVHEDHLVSRSYSLLHASEYGIGWSADMKCSGPTVEMYTTMLTPENLEEILDEMSKV
jgi:hypothetical protein